MRMMAFARRNMKEMLRDPLTLVFGALFPLALLLMMHLIQRNVPVELFTLERLLPGIAVFGQSFLALFAAQLLSRDRSTALMMRLLVSPMTALDFILGYALPMIPLAIVQGLLCTLCAVLLGLPLSWNIAAMLLVLMPGALFFISLGLIFGCLLNDKQVGGICGALLTNLSAWLSGAWFDLSLVGGAFEAAAYLLPFANAVDAGRAALAGNYGALPAPLAITAAYGLVSCLLAVVLLAKRVRRGDKSGAF